MRWLGHRRRAAAAAALVALLASTAFGGAAQAPDVEALLLAGRFSDVEAMARERLAQLEAQGLDRTPAAADALDTIVRSLLRLPSRAAEIPPLLARAVAIRESAGDPDALMRTRVIGLRASEATENFAALARDLPLALAEADRLWPASHPRNLEVQRLEGMSRFRQGRIDEAVRLLTGVLEALEATQPDALLTGEAAQTLGLAHSFQRNHAAAIRAAETARRIRERHGDLVGLAFSTNLLGMMHGEIGDYTRARQFLSQSLCFREQVFGRDYPLNGVTLGSLAALQAQMTDYEEAAASYERALALLKDSWRSVLYGANYGQLLVDLDQMDRAGAVFATALAGLERFTVPLGEQAVLFDQYGHWLHRRGRLAEARREKERATAIREKLNLPLGLGVNLRDLARMSIEAGDDRSALTLLERALDVHERMGREHTELTRTRGDLAELLARLGNLDRARPQALEAVDASHQFLQLSVRGLPERQAIGVTSRRRHLQDVLLSIVERTPDAAYAAEAFERVVRARAFVLDEVSRRQRLADRSSALVEMLVSAREQLARLTLRGPGAVGQAAYDTLIAGARAQLERAEETLAAAHARFRDDLDDARVGLAEVRAALEPDVALVGFVEYGDVIAVRPGTAAPRRYAAFVLPAAGRAPVFVPLGPAGPIETAVRDTRAELLREAVAGGRGGRRLLALYRQSAARLRALVWDPLGPHLQGAGRVMLVPDGALHLVSFAALPVGARGYLVENGPTLHYLATERDVARRFAPPGQGLLAVGNPAFTPGASTATASTRSPRGGVVDCLDLPALQFDDLPGAAAEAAAVAGMWPAARPPAALMTGAAASEAEFKRRAPGSRVLHLATHGFFAGARDCSAPRDAAEAPLNTALLRSGLAFAGANQRMAAGAAADDGMLTAAEIANLDLTGVEWAVLSACDTGLGSIANGEGVFGLRRAFRVAGVATVIMTLWPVDDVATKAWIERLYAARLAGRSTPAAMRDASRVVLAERRRSGQSDHPFYWAGFVAAGDWR